MAVILCLDTATAVCSVALGSDGKVWATRESAQKNVHSSSITSFIQEILLETGFDLSGLDAVAVSKGPGSYTGLRIGVSTAKGLCYALGKPLIAISSLRALAHGMAQHIRRKGATPGKFLFCPMIDARRMEVYSAFYNENNELIRDIQADIVTSDSYQEYLTLHKVLFFGDGAAKCRQMLGGDPNAVFHEDFVSSATHMIELAEERFHRKQFEDVAYFEPFYLKDFIPGVPKVKGLKE
jgi:tRNA threonylcarbamoyladenosine biosynthesis protein TsaB